MFEHRDAFMETLRAGQDMRKRVFDTLEERYGQDFGSGRVGRNLYDALHSAVHDAAVPGAAEEFENRFLPLLNGQRLRGKAQLDPTELTDQDYRAGRRGWIAALCAVTIVSGALVLGLYAANTVVAGSPTRTKPLISAAEVTEPVLETVATAKPVETISDDQELSSEH
jgi:hypothetical protein